MEACAHEGAPKSCTCVAVMARRGASQWNARAKRRDVGPDESDPLTRTVAESREKYFWLLQVTTSFQHGKENLLHR